ncbi:hypothetical protein [Rathayibacter sp. AY1E6]|uniref:hypothetical protein n=1 Tax=Rathayibacter sp. AY1E6 TaxID=2080554 RepID=UPI000CE80D44|nr:hypothetical protein [Rathayibacter sp. AY1E6]PPF72091.1 hypothetical protein C5C46_07390 [Rathayibacter sp. AY1E6]
MPSQSISYRLERRLQGLRRFTDGDAVLRTPGRLRSPYGETEWLALGNEARRAHLSERLTEELLAETATSSLPAAASAPVEPNAVSPAAVEKPTADTRPEYVAGRSYLPCSDGCGKFYRARPDRPGFRYCPRKK